MARSREAPFARRIRSDNSGTENGAARRRNLRMPEVVSPQSPRREVLRDLLAAALANCCPAPVVRSIDEPGRAAHIWNAMARDVPRAEKSPRERERWRPAPGARVKRRVSASGVSNLP